MDFEQAISAPSQQAFDAAALKTAKSYAPPSTDTSLADLRWEGMSNAQLAAAVQQLNNGSGAAAMTTAADALANVAADLSQINDALQTQLQAIGVNWQSQTASDLADQMLSASAAYGGTVTDQGGGSSTAINQQAEAYATARNAAPQPQALAGNTAQSNSAMAAGNSPFTGHGNDHAAQAGKANAARNQAVDAMNNYTSSSQSNLGGYAPPPPPPGIGVGTGPSSGTSTSGYPGPVSVGNPGTPVLGGGGGTTGVGTLPPGVPGGSGGVTGVGTLPPGVPGGSGGVTGLPGGGVPGGVPGTINLGPGGASSGVGMPGGGGFPSGGVPGGGGGSIPPGG
ncbi:MAG TPA: PPE domain-containing protein, partial [Pseudonocardiaceae bacterium]|nr:PPE domain-containing protein [Pseudonocardiaceae bacterium]